MAIYPKSFALGKRSVEPSTCFILMPFSAAFNSIYGLIKSFLNPLGIKCNRADDIFESLPILSIVIEKILRAEFIIADLTSRNPNVFYEVGLAHCFRDSDCVILIAQSLEDIPFDIRHLPIIIYDRDNKFLLEENLKNRILTSREKNGKKRFLLDFFSGTEFSFPMVEKVIDSIREKNTQIIEDLYSLLSDQDDFSDKKVRISNIRNIFDEIDSFSTFADGLSRRLLYKIKLDVLINISNIDELKDFCLSFLSKNSRDVFEINRRDDLSFAADYACQLVRDGLFKSISINWLLDYLKNSRVGGIDVIRNKIDEFLVKIDDSDVNKGLQSLLFSENFTLRESVVDILTQKGNQETYNYLISNIGIEKNVYVVRSIINGLARYENPSSCDIVSKWFQENKNIIIKNNAAFLCEVGINFFKKFKAYHYAEELVRFSRTL